jgi:hypothetical protein
MWRVYIAACAVAWDFADRKSKSLIKDYRNEISPDVKHQHGVVHTML